MTYLTVEIKLWDISIQAVSNCPGGVKFMTMDQSRHSRLFSHFVTANCSIKKEEDCVHLDHPTSVSFTCPD